MDTRTFWGLIEESRRVTGDPEERASWLDLQITDARDALDFHVCQIRLLARACTCSSRMAARTRCSP
ncbi:hypothetical protein [Nonomuraea sp. JJY05]|uniref:hypothetical protein n=1 Tax=Nonomuraea sp. JJY05 TaxID=3350255 RepID=UPI00373EB076